MAAECGRYSCRVKHGHECYKPKSQHVVRLGEVLVVGAARVGQRQDHHQEIQANNSEWQYQQSDKLVAMPVGLALKIPVCGNLIGQPRPAPSGQREHRDDQCDLRNLATQRKFHGFFLLTGLPTSSKSSMAAIVCSTTETLRL